MDSGIKYFYELIRTKQSNTCLQTKSLFFLFTGQARKNKKQGCEPNIPDLELNLIVSLRRKKSLFQRSRNSDLLKTIRYTFLDLFILVYLSQKKKGQTNFPYR